MEGPLLIWIHQILDYPAACAESRLIYFSKSQMGCAQLRCRFMRSVLVFAVVFSGVVPTPVML